MSAATDSPAPAWTRLEPGMYESRCGTYYIARHEVAYNDTRWLPYRRGVDGWYRVGWRRGMETCRTLRQAKQACATHAATKGEQA